MAPRQPFIRRDFYSDPRRKARSGVVRALARPMRRAGFDLEVRSFYSPIPDVAALPEEVWSRRSDMPGVAMDLDAQLGFVEGELAPYLAEFRPPREPTDDRLAYHLANGLFQGGDADLLYAIVRWSRPERVVEVGAGFSTLVTAQAVRANREAGTQTAFVTYDPYAEPPTTGVDGLDAVRPVAAEDLGAEEISDLQPGDVLFIDSSHTVRTGGDVVHLLLDVVPRLPAGVLVHVHDVFLPYEYPRQFLERARWYWTEQYLVQALLVGNPRLEVLVAAHALWRERHDRLVAAIPNLDGGEPPLSFWMRVGSG